MDDALRSLFPPLKTAVEVRRFLNAEAALLGANIPPAEGLRRLEQ